MPLTLELPPTLGHELKEEAAKAGVSFQEHATLLLLLATALLEDRSTPFGEAVRKFISERSLDAEQVSSVFEELVGRCMEASFNGVEITSTREDLRSWRKWYVHGRTVEWPEIRPSALAKYAHVRGTSEDFAREKRFEIEREDRRTR